MIYHIKAVEYTENYVLNLEFNTTERRTIDLESYLWGPVFEPLKDKAYFKQVKLDPEAETIVWPNGADFAPAFLYRHSHPLTEAVA